MPTELIVVGKVIGLLRSGLSLAKAVLTPRVRTVIANAAKYIYNSVAKPAPIRFGKNRLVAGTVFTANMAVLTWIILVLCALKALCDFSILSRANNDFLILGMIILGLLDGLAFGLLGRTAIHLTKAAVWGYRHSGMRHGMRKLKVVALFWLLAVIQGGLLSLPAIS